MATVRRFRSLALRYARKMTISIRREPLDSAVAQALIGALNAELARVYPEEGANHFRLDLDEVAPGRGAFFVAVRADEPLGCAAVRKLDAVTAEVKRMYVAPAARGQGLGRRLLDRSEAEARGLGVERLVLETGTRQNEALALYRSSGFEPIAAYGEYIGSPLSLCLAKRLG